MSRWGLALAAVGLLAAAPARGAELPWFHDFADGYVEALKSHRVAVVVFTNGPGANGRALVDGLNGTLGLYALTPKAVFIETDVSKDRAGWNIANDLHVVRLPSLSVIAPRADLVREVYRLEGYQTSARVLAEVAPVVERTFDEINPR